MSAEIPYWWPVTTKVWVVLLIVRTAWEIWFNSFLRRHLAGKPVVELPNVGCFLRITFNMFFALGVCKVSKRMADGDGGRRNSLHNNNN